jgi:hypothetical protein
MKKYLITALITTLAFSSCKKDDNNNNNNPSPAQTKTELISAKKWTPAAITIDGSDAWGLVDDCSKDDFTLYKADGTYIEDDGATKCDPADDQQYISTWKFIENETKIVTDSDTAKITELTATKLVLTVSAQGATIVATFTGN